MDRHKEKWERLETLLDRCNKSGVRSLDAGQLRELGSLYRQAASHLAVARTRGYDPDLIEYLNTLMGRAHGVVHARRRRRFVPVGYFFGVSVPRTFKRCWPYFAVTAGLTIIITVAGMWATAGNPGWAEIFTTPIFRRHVEQFLQQQSAPGEYFQETAEAVGGPALSGLLMTHNIKVALICFALGITAGLGTLYVLVRNALLLGGVLGLGLYSGELLTMGAVIVPHGVIEISAILLAAAAGLRMGYGIVNPGDLLRKDALVLAAHDAVRLVMATVPIFITAGLIEGLISPLSEGTVGTIAARYAVGIITGAALYTYLLAGDYIFARFYPSDFDTDELDGA
ncbi:MAG: stage II sporulation protein M [Armatimonadota bacterium]